MVPRRRETVFVLRRSPRVIPVGTLEGFAGLDVSAQHVRATVALRQPLESLLSSSSAGHDDCDEDDDEAHTTEDTADNWTEREFSATIALNQGCRRRLMAGLSRCIG